MPQIEFNEKSKKCLICGSDKLRLFKARAFDALTPSSVNIIECRNCVFAWQYPFGRTEKQSAQYFKMAYADNGQTTSDYFNENRKRDIAKLEFDFVSTLPVNNRTLLDVGAGAGIFAEIVASNNWSVTAVDPSIDVNKFENYKNIRAIEGSIDKISNNELFDVITLWDVVEHTTEPVEIISNAKRHLKKGGWLVIETGNYKSADRVACGTSHWMYQLDHRWYFSPESIEHLLIKMGFSQFIFSDKALRPGWNGSLGYAGPSRAHLLMSIIKDPLHLFYHLSRYFGLKQAKGWEKSGVEIFTVAAR